MLDQMDSIVYAEIKKLLWKYKINNKKSVFKNFNFLKHALASFSFR